jgi:hypothetical protein
MIERKAIAVIQGGNTFFAKPTARNIGKRTIPTQHPGKGAAKQAIANIPTNDEYIFSVKAANKDFHHEKPQTLINTIVSISTTMMNIIPFVVTPKNKGAIDPKLPQKIGTSARAGFSSRKNAARQRRKTQNMREIFINPDDLPYNYSLLIDTRI